MRKFFKSITLTEWIIWSVSTVAVTVCFFVFKNTNYLYLVGAVIGFTAVLFVSKGHPLGQLITVIFSVFYGIISYSFSYYGEMITYLGISTPMAIAALISWLKNPYKQKAGEVKVNVLSVREWGIFLIVSAVVTAAFYFILYTLNTSNLIMSTVSVFTSFTAAYLTVRRSRFYALGYALNDAVLIVMWSLASVQDFSYLPMAVCFCSFLILDLYGFINWRRMSRRQRREGNDRMDNC